MEIKKIANGKYTVFQNIRYDSANPDTIHIYGENGLDILYDTDYRYDDAYAIAMFSIDGKSEVEIKEGGIHRLMYNDIVDKYDDVDDIDMVVAGRLWTESQVIAFWGDNYLSYLGTNIRYPSSQDMKECLKGIADASSLLLLKELESDKSIIAIPVMDYIRGGFTGQESKISDFDKDTSSAYKINRLPGEDEYTKLRNYRLWNGMEIDEGKRRKKTIKITKADLRKMVNEAVKALIRDGS